MEYYVAIKKEGNLTFCDSMDGPGHYYVKWNKSQRNINTVWFHLYVESNEQNKLTNKIETNL